MQYQDKASLRKSLTGFLNQRLRVYQMMYTNSKNRDIILTIAMIQKIKTCWAIVSPWDYWRHCREIILQEQKLITILPSVTGKHLTIRKNMLKLIEHCREVQSMPAELYRHQKEITAAGRGM